MTLDEELAHADAVLAGAARGLAAAQVRVRAARFEYDRAEREAAGAYRTWSDASARRARLFAARQAADSGGRGAPVAPGFSGGPPEASAWSVQTVLLALGGVLLSIAAIVFTVVAWGAFGIGGRAAILAGVTGLTFAVPVLLHRRGLASTAETIGLLGLVLLALDGYALRHVGWAPPDLDPAAYAGLVLGATAAVALVYPLVVPLRALRPAGLVVAHPAVVLLFIPYADAVALFAALGLALVAADLAARWSARDAALRGVASLCGGFTGIATVLCALISAAVPSGSSDATAQHVVGTLVLIGLAAAVVLAAETVRDHRPVARGLASALAVPLVVVGPVLQWLRYGPDGWGLTGFSAALAVIAAVTLVLPRPWRIGTTTASAVLAAGAALLPAAAVGFTLLAPLTRPDLVWRATSAARPVWVVPGTRPDPDLVGALLALTVAAALLIAALGSGIAHQAARHAAPIGAAAVVVLTPAAAGAPIWLTVLAVGLAAILATAAGALPGRGALLLWVGGVLAAHSIVVALAARDTTLVAVGVVSVLYAVLALRSTGVRQLVATGLALGALGAWAAAAATALTASASGWAGGPGPAGVAVGLTALLGLALTRATRDARPSVATLTAVLTGVGAYVGAGLAALTPPGVVDRSTIAVLALTAAGVSATAALTATAARVWGAWGAAAPGLVVAAVLLAAGLLAVVLGPLTWLASVWGGAPEDAGRLGPDLTFPGTILDPVVLLGAAAVVLCVRWYADRRTPVWLVVPLVAPGAVELAPALRAPWAVALGVLLAVAVAGAVSASAPGPRIRRVLGAVPAAVATLTAVAWALADRTATLVVLGVVLATGAAIAVAARDTAARVTAAATVAAASVGLAFATAAATGVPTPYTLVTAALVLVLPGVIVRPHVPGTTPARVVVDVLDVGAAAAGALSLLATVAPWNPDRPVLALTATLLGVPLGLASLRPSRRWCAWLVPAVELVALWAWLAHTGVTVPEAYTLPAAALAAAFGLYTLHRLPATSSWPTLGPALTVAAVPTLAVALTDGTLGLRVLLLGVAALAVTLAGAATCRQAPFLLGATVLTLVAARALGPVLPALAESVPTWVPLSLAGALLLTVGATYERRRRDAARLAGYVRDMR